MKHLLAIALLLWMGEGMILAAPQKAASPSQEIQPEVVSPSASLPPSTQVAPGGEGFMEPQQVKDLLKRVYLAEFRTNDLLTQVHPESWKMPESARNSFLESFGALRRQMGALEEWRAALDQRPDSMYLAYMMHASIDAILPRLDGVTRIISQRENSSLGAQFSQAGNQLFDLEQTLQPYLVYLLRNQDQMLYAAQANLVGCEKRLGAALAGQREPAKIMKNIVPDFKGRRTRRSDAPASSMPAPATQPKSPAPPAKK
jgi:hypothetical protein